ncbi:MAG: hypothetical protein WKF96_14345 [Solirubrobacteraceae bacterium]
MSSSRARLRSDSIGTLVHEAIAAALTRERGGAPADAMAAGKAVVAPHLAPVYRLALIHRVTTATAVYLRDLRRDPSWVLTGVEVVVADVRLDLLFVNRAGRVEADEIKTGLLGPATEMPWIREQIGMQIAAGRDAFGSAFGGVRLVDLPRRKATLFRSAGGRTAA